MMWNTVLSFDLTETWKEIFLIYLYFLLATQYLFVFLILISSHVTLQALLYYPCLFTLVRKRLVLARLISMLDHIWIDRTTYILFLFLLFCRFLPMQLAVIPLKLSQSVLSKLLTDPVVQGSLRW